MKDDFLLAEYGHLMDSLLRNEESGEKRAAFFLSAVGAAGAVLAFAFGRESAVLPRERVFDGVAATAFVLLVLGLMTTRRLIQRHIVTDRFIFALRSLRRAFLTRDEMRSLPNAFINPYEPHTPRDIGVFSLGKGGWLETIALVNSILAAIVGACVVRSVDSKWVAYGVPLVAFAIAWSGQMLDAQRKLAKKYDELSKSEALGSMSDAA